MVNMVNKEKNDEVLQLIYDIPKKNVQIEAKEIRAYPKMPNAEPFVITEYTVTDENGLILCKMSKSCISILNGKKTLLFANMIEPGVMNVLFNIIKIKKACSDINKAKQFKTNPGKVM